MKCLFCGGVPLLGSEPYTCSACAERLGTHFAFICTGCNVCYWMPKTPENVLFVAESKGISPNYLVENPVYFWIKACKRCLAPSERLKLVKKTEWKQ